MSGYVELPEPRHRIVRSPCKKFYTTPAGALPGATTILGRTSAGKERLEQWLKRPDAPAISEAARNRGTWLHTQTEDWINARAAGSDPPSVNHFAFGAYWRSMKPWLESHWTHVVALEKPVYHPAGYAGSFDALGYATFGREPEALTLFDWKTSAKRRTDDLVEDYFCQLGAYAHAIEHVYGIRPERAVLVIARPSVTPDTWELGSTQLQEATQRFLTRLERFYAMPPD